MKSMYRVAIDQDLIKNEVDTIILIDSIKAAEIYTFFKNKICGEKLKKVSRSPSDIRLGLEFFRNGRVVKTIGVTPQRTIYMGDIVYMCNMEALKHIDYFSLELPKLLCLH
jgi:hypothetical protein